MQTLELLDKRSVDLGLMGQMVGFQPDPNEVQRVVQDLTPSVITKERLIGQSAELQLINLDATLLKMSLESKGLSKMPTGYAILTSGFEPPPQSIPIGKFSEGVFVGFPRPDAVGHEGGVHAIPINEEGDYILAMTGRPHPTEWIGERFAHMITSHPLRVMKEMARRHRVEYGKDPFFFLTYLSGASENYGMVPGDAAIALSDNEYANVVHPGFGPVALLEQYLGPHFQAKMGRSSDVYLAQKFAQKAKERNVPLFAGSIVGTPGVPEFETDEENIIWSRTVDEARNKYTGKIARQVFGEKGEGKLVPIHVMGVSAELANMRQKFKNEPEFRKVVLCLATDPVGAGSVDTDHDTNWNTAMREAPKYMDLILEVSREAAASPYYDESLRIENFSLKNKLASLSPTVSI